MNSVNTVYLLGHIGRDARLRQTGDSQVAHVRLATNRATKDAQGEWAETPEWHDVTIWDAGGLGPMLRRGVRLHVTGRLRTRSWEQDGDTRWRTEVNCKARDVIVLTPRNSPEDAEF